MDMATPYKLIPVNCHHQRVWPTCLAEASREGGSYIAEAHGNGFCKSLNHKNAAGKVMRINKPDSGGFYFKKHESGEKRKDWIV